MTFFRVLPLLLLITPLLLADPVLSSKAVRNAMRAKEIIYSHDNAHLAHATECLQTILCEPSFRRLDSHTQVEIILLLSEAYERQHRYQDQEMVLLLHAKRPELFRHHTLLKTTLAQSFVQQGRIEDAENLLTTIIQSSCAHYSLEEKSEIAHVLSYKDEYLQRLLSHADSLINAAKWSEALSNLTTVISSINRQQYPFQSSVVEKRRLRQKILWQIANIHFCTKRYEECIKTLLDWDEDLIFSKKDSSIGTRRLFLLALAYECLQNKEKSESFLQKYLATNSPKLPNLDSEVQQRLNLARDREITQNISQPYLLWKAHDAIQNHDSSQLQQCLESIPPEANSLQPILSGFKAALDGKTLDAYQLLLRGLASVSNSPWKEAAYHLLADTAFERALLLIISNQETNAKKLIEEVLSIISPSKTFAVSIRRAYFHCILFSCTKDPSHLEKARGLVETTPDFANTALLALLQQKRPESFEGFSLPDAIFLEWAFDGTVSLRPVEDPKSILGQYLKAAASYQKAISGEISFEAAASYLTDCASNPNLADARPQILCLLAELFLHEGRTTESYEFVHEALQEYPTHARLHHTILSCIFSFESTPNLQTEYEILCQYLFNKPTISHTLLLCMHLFETKKQIIDQDPILKAFCQALIARDECYARLDEASVSKEPAIVKESIENATKAAFLARSNALEVISSLRDPASSCIVWGFILGIHEKMIESLEHCISSEYAFIELPSLAETQKTQLQLDLEKLSTEVPEWPRFLARNFFENCLALQTSVDVYNATLNRHTDRALKLLQEANPSVLYASHCGIRAALFLAKTLREASSAQKAYTLLTPFEEQSVESTSYELALEIAMEKSLCLRELKQIDQAMNVLAWIINGPYASSLRLKAMILRADLYLVQHRTDLAIRQLESVAAKGGEWGAVAERKLRELYGNN